MICLSVLGSMIHPGDVVVWTQILEWWLLRLRAPGGGGGWGYVSEMVDKLSCRVSGSKLRCEPAGDGIGL